MLILLLLAQQISQPNLDLEFETKMQVSSTLMQRFHQNGRMEGIVDETGTYLFDALARYTLTTSAVAPYRSYIEIFGPASRPTSYGNVYSNWVLGPYPPREKYVRQLTDKVYYSEDGTSLWLGGQGRGASYFGWTWLGTKRPGAAVVLNTIHASVFHYPAMGTDGKSFALVRKHGETRSTKQPGHVPLPAHTGDIALGRQDSTKLKIKKVPKELSKDGFVGLYPWSYDPGRNLLIGLRAPSTHEIAITDLSKPLAETRFIPVPVSLAPTRKDAPVGILRAWLTPKKGNVLVQFSLPLNHSGIHPPVLALFDRATEKWRIVGKYKVWAWSGSGKLLLVNAGNSNTAAWLIQVKE